MTRRPGWWGGLGGSLQLRVSLAVSLAFVLVAAALLGRDYLEIQRAQQARSALAVAGQQLQRSMERQAERRDALLIAEDWLQVLNQNRAEMGAALGTELGDVRLAVVDPGGWLPLGANWSDPGALAPPGQTVTLRIEGRDYWVWRSPEAQHGAVVAAEPAIADGTLLRWLLRELAPSLLIAFPLILLPVWLAVRIGLRPLSRLAGRISSLDLAQPQALPAERGELAVVGEAFNALMQRLLRLRQREQALMHDTAHELRTPLAAVLARAHGLLQADDPTQRATRAAELEGAVERVAHLSAQLLLLARLDASADETPVPCDLARALREELAPLLSSAAAAKHDFVLDAPAELPRLVRRQAFRAVLGNLLENALRYTPAGSRLEVRLAAQVADPEGWTLVVADDGPGLPSALAGRVFDRFVRGDHPQIPGTGLGLAIARQAAHSLGGVLTAGPGLDGRGVGFTLKVPVPVTT